jgi:hypothetical protein
MFQALANPYLTYPIAADRDILITSPRPMEEPPAVRLLSPLSGLGTLSLASPSLPMTITAGAASAFPRWGDGDVQAPASTVHAAGTAR